jgi:hypothetical protein
VPRRHRPPSRESSHGSTGAVERAKGRTLTRCGDRKTDRSLSRQMVKLRSRSPSLDYVVRIVSAVFSRCVVVFSVGMTRLTGTQSITTTTEPTEPSRSKHQWCSVTSLAVSSLPLDQTSLQRPPSKSETGLLWRWASTARAVRCARKVDTTCVRK